MGRSSIADRVDHVDESLFGHISSGGTSDADRSSLLSLHATLAGRGPFDYLEVGSYLGSSMQALVADDRCRQIVAIDKRETVSADEREQPALYPNNTTAEMLARLATVPGSDLGKILTLDTETADLDPGELRADLCFIDAEHTNSAALRDARFCRKVINDRGVIVFHDRTLVDQGLRRFLSELGPHRAYPLAHDLLVVELGVQTLLTDSRVQAQVPRSAWLIASRLGRTSTLMTVTAAVRRRKADVGEMLLRLGALRMRRPARRAFDERPASRALEPFVIYTFVDDETKYSRMVDSFVAAGFSVKSLRRLPETDDPYAAITRLGSSDEARYPVLCDQNVTADQGFGAAELLDALERLDGIDSAWEVAGHAGISRTGQFVRCVAGQSDVGVALRLPQPVVSLDEAFLVLNPRNRPACSDGLSGMHLFGTDISLSAIKRGGAAYVIDFMLNQTGIGRNEGEYPQDLEAFKQVWHRQFRFAYVFTSFDTLFLSRESALRRVFGSGFLMSCVGAARYKTGKSSPELA